MEKNTQEAVEQVHEYIKNYILKYGEEWSFFGGALEEGENSKQALLREIKEELWFNIDSWDIKYLGELVHFTDFGVEYHRYLYGINITQNITEFDDKEGSGAYFFDLEDVKKLKFNTNVEAEILQLQNNFVK